MSACSEEQNARLVSSIAIKRGAGWEGRMLAMEDQRTRGPEDHRPGRNSLPKPYLCIHLRGVSLFASVGPEEREMDIELASSHKASHS